MVPHPRELVDIRSPRPILREPFIGRDFANHRPKNHLPIQWGYFFGMIGLTVGALALACLSLLGLIDVIEWIQTLFSAA